jgi:hypothetical protein
MYLGARARVLDAAKRLTQNAPEAAIYDATGLWQLHPVIRREVLGLWRKGRFEDAARLTGSHFQQDTQWVYRTGFRPELLRGEFGKLMGTFGVWPLNYVEYLRQIAMMPETPTRQKMLWMGRWLAANSAIVGAFGGVGAALGMGPEALQHTMGWTFFGPAAYAGGPMVEFLPAAMGLWHELAVQRTVGPNTRTVRRTAENLIPGRQLVRDITRTFGEESESFTLGRGYTRRVITEEPENVVEAAFRFATGIQRKP